jgi:hypothetical protein
MRQGFAWNGKVLVFFANKPMTWSMSADAWQRSEESTNNQGWCKPRCDKSFLLGIDLAQSRPGVMQFIDATCTFRAFILMM